MVYECDIHLEGRETLLTQHTLKILNKDDLHRQTTYDEHNVIAMFYQHETYYSKYFSQ